ncbi:MAG TPA: insulinase family protein [Pyrinomonadaceae bacterium]|nr:insulinase family protein [Pyrinomonadaceae bacterium]
MTRKTLKSPLLRRSIMLLLALAAICPTTVSAQTAPEPEREMLLNGLRILYWPQPGNPNVLLKLRIHSGAAFDLTDKAGMMALLGDALFPDPATREYMTEELGGRLEVTTTHDSIEITLVGKSSGLERMIDFLRGSVLTTQLSVESVAALRTARVKLLSEKPPTLADTADQATAARVLGNFPYARPSTGTPASVAKVERADLLLARERFLNADNASLAIVGGVEKPRMMRALRQLLGLWGKSDRTIPSTFRQPGAPDTRVLVVDSPGATNAEIRLAIRGLARGDKDALAANILALIIRDRWKAAVPDLSQVSVRDEAHVLPGIFVLSASAPTGNAAKASTAAQDIIKSLIQTGPTAQELESARGVILNRLATEFSQPETMSTHWLDMDTFKSARPSTVATLVRSLTPGDIQRVTARLFKDVAMATVVAGNSEQLKATFTGNVEIKSAVAPEAKPIDPVVPAKKP